MMKANNVLLSLIAMLVIFILAYGMDKWIHQLKIEVGNGVSPTPVWWANSICNFILVGTCLLLFWFVTFKWEAGRITAVLYTLIGFFLLFYNPMAISFQLTIFPAFWPQTLMLTAAAFIAVIGLYNLINTRKH